MTLSREQIRLGSNVYGNAAASPVSGLEQSPKPSIERTTIVHEVPLSVYWPQKDLGPRPPEIQGRLLLPESSVHGFMADASGGSTGERKLYWVDSGVEVYAYVRSAKTLSRTRLGEGGAEGAQWVSFSFVSTRTAVYRASDNAILWGGS